MLKYALCETKKSSNNSEKPKSKKANNSEKPKPKTKKTSNSEKPKSKKASNNSEKPKEPKKKTKMKFVIKPKKVLKFSEVKDFSVDNVDEQYKIISKDRIVPKQWELPNRKIFSNWFNKTYESYRAKKNSITKGKKKKGFDLFNHQKVVRDYLNMNSPYRGLLLFHGLGVGKTCASIGIAEAFRGENRDIIILLNKSLKQNFKVNLMKCGFEYYRLNNHWFYHKFTHNDVMYSYAKYLGIPQKILNNGGCWFVDFSKEPNFTELSQKQQDLLDEQIEAFISKKYSFIHIDGLNKKKLETMVEKRIFDNKLLIIDEAHNLTNAMSKMVPGVRGRLLKKLIMDANNLKMVLLSGTPMINNLFETAQLFNLLRGYIITFNFILIGKPDSEAFDNVVRALKENKFIDQVISKKSDKMISITRNPRGFVTNNSNNGIIEDSSADIDDNEFIEKIKEELTKMKYSSNVNIIKHTALPDDETAFMNLFYNEAKNTLKNPLLYQSRIMGLVSFFRTEDKSLLPTVTNDSVEKIDMSPYQFLLYSKVRKDEIEQDKMKSKKKTKGPKKKTGSEKSEGDSNLFDDKKSSYRAYSRMHCSFVFPEEHPRPYPGGLSDKEEDILNDVLDKQDNSLNNSDEQALKEEKKMIIKKYESEKARVLKELNRNGETFFKLNEREQLLKYSPKYNAILDRCNKVKGNVFIYTEYKTLEGIAVLQIILNANGYAPFRLGENSSGEMVQVFESDDEITKPKYAFWGGNAEESDILRKIYNNEFDALPTSLKKQFEMNKQNNLRGDIIKVLLTTKTGAEGIDLHNVRQVHIVEPYWNPVRTEQVKGRAVRVGSHIKLPEKDRTVEIYTYVTTIPDKLLKTDKTILDDSEGMCSDEVLFDISQKKLGVMTHLLQLIKEVSIDCSINIEETKGDDEELKCLSYGTSLTRDSYSYLPNITRDQQDSEIKRKFKKIQWKPEFISFKKKGVMVSYAVKKSSKDGEPDILFDASATRSGQPGEPLGEMRKVDGKTKFKFYKK